MSKDLSQIRDTLSVLRRQLTESEEVSGALRASLLETFSQVDQALLNLPNLRDSADRDPHDAESLGERLSEGALEFEQSHPALAKTMRSLIDTLAQMGI